jgi:ankyrin repeat protein
LPFCGAVSLAPPLHRAVRRREHLDATCATTADELGWNALHHAAAVGWVEGARLALDSGCPAAGTTVDGITPLHLAVTAGAHPLVALLLDDAAVIRAERVGAPAAPGWNATLRAADRGDETTLRTLHAAGVLKTESAGAVWLRRQLTASGGALWVHRAGDFSPMERPTPEQVRWMGHVDVAPDMSALLGLRLERGPEGTLVRARSEGVELERVDVGPDGPVTHGQRVPPPWPDMVTTERLQVALHDEPHPHPMPPVALGAPAFLGLTAVVEALLRRGVHWWEAPEAMASALVSGRRHPGVVRVLVASLPDAALNSVAAVAGAILSLAARETGVVDALTERGMDLNTGVPGRGTPLLCAIRTGVDSLVDHVLDRGADVNRVVAPPFTPERTTPLREAILAGDAAMVERLLGRGALPNLAADPANVSTHPLGSLCRVSAYRQDAQGPILAHLMRAGADPRWTDSHGRNALHVERHTSVVTALFHAGVPLDVPDASGWTGLQRAMLDSAPVALGFLRHATASDLQQQDGEGNTLVHLACFGGWPAPETMEALRSRGLSLDARNHAGLTPVQRALFPAPAALGGRMGGGTVGFPVAPPLRAVGVLLALGAGREGLLAFATAEAAAGRLGVETLHALEALLGAR